MCDSMYIVSLDFQNVSVWFWMTSPQILIRESGQTKRNSQWGAALVGTPEQCIFDLLWLFFRGSIQTWGSWEAPEGITPSPQTNRALDRGSEEVSRRTTLGKTHGDRIQRNIACQCMTWQWRHDMTWHGMPWSSREKWYNHIYEIIGNSERSPIRKILWWTRINLMHVCFVLYKMNEFDWEFCPWSWIKCSRPGHLYGYESLLVFKRNHGIRSPEYINKSRWEPTTVRGRVWGGAKSLTISVHFRLKCLLLEKSPFLG